MTFRFFFILIILLFALFIHEAVLSFLPWPFSSLPIIFACALPLAQRVSPFLGVGLIVLFGVSMSFLGAFESLGIHYLVAAVIVGFSAYRFFASRSGLAYIGLCVVTSLSFSLGTVHVVLYALLTFFVSIIGGALFIWLSSLRHMFLPLRSARSRSL